MPAETLPSRLVRSGMGRIPSKGNKGEISAREGDMRRSAHAFVVILMLGVVVGPRTGSGLPPIGWVPDQFGLPFIADVASDGKPVPLYLTRRIVPDPTVKGRFLLGTATFGLYESIPGVGWTTMTPHCFPRVSVDPEIDEFVYGTVDAAMNALGALAGCGVEAIAFDPQDPLGVYVSTYNLVLDLSNLSNPTLEYGGVYKAQLKVGSVGVSTDGLIWRKLLGGMRGNAIAVSRPTSSSATTIAVGRIQQRGTSTIGTDSNDWCSGCSPSLYISGNDGTSWTTYSFGETCSPTPSVINTSRLVGNLAFDPLNAEVLYAAANSGLWTVIKSGSAWTFSNSLAVCGSAPGFAVTKGRPGGPSPRRIYVGTKAGEIYSATTGPSGPAGFGTAMTLSAPIQGQILSVILDENDPTEHTLIVSAYTAPPKPPASATGGVYKVVVNSTFSGATVTDLKASFTNPLKSAPNPVGPTWNSTLEPLLAELALVYDPRWRASLFLAQHPLEDDLLFASTVLGGIWVRSGTTDIGAL
jgi:hypothetical protein